MELLFTIADELVGLLSRIELIENSRYTGKHRITIASISARRKNWLCRICGWQLLRVRVGRRNSRSAQRLLQWNSSCSHGLHGIRPGRSVFIPLLNLLRILSYHPWIPTINLSKSLTNMLNFTSRECISTIVPWISGNFCRQGSAFEGRRHSRQRQIFHPSRENRQGESSEKYAWIFPISCVSQRFSFAGER